MNETSEEEFTGFFRSEQPVIYHTVYLMMGDPDRAREITQDAFTQAFVHWKKVRRYDRPGAWVRRIAIRLAMRATKREAMHAVLIRRDARAEAIEPTTNEIELIDAIRKLQSKDKALIVLFYFEDLPALEIAEVLDMSEGAVRVGLNRARAKLAKNLGVGLNDVGR